MRVVFFGTSVFAVPAIRALAEHIVLVVTQPDRVSGRGMKLRASPAKEAAHELGLNTSSPIKARDIGFVEEIRALNADVLVTAAYGQILSTALLESANRGGVNLHGSILPEYRGAAPIQRSILDGKIETGITLIQMDKGMDTGDIIAIERTPIGPDEIYTELQDRLAVIAAEMAKDWVPRIAAGDYPRTPQDHDRMSLAPKIEREETQINVTKSAEEEYRRYRAFSVTPGTSIELESGPLKLREVRYSTLQGKAGTVLQTSPELVLAFAESALELRKVQPAGKPIISGRDFANGLRIKPGEELVKPT